ncbi:hypothetical protein KKG81_04645, partial [bacterium]|nr:hypothetical protein [bacterium]
MNIVINTRKKYHPQDDEYAFGCLLAKRVVFHLQHARDEQDSEDIKNLYRNVYKDLGIEYTPQILEKSVGQLSSNFVRQQINHGSIDKKEYDILEHERNLARVEKDCRLKEEKRF